MFRALCCSSSRPSERNVSSLFHSRSLSNRAARILLSPFLLIVLPGVMHPRKHVVWRCFLVLLVGLSSQCSSLQQLFPFLGFFKFALDV